MPLAYAIAYRTALLHPAPANVAQNKQQEDIVYVFQTELQVRIRLNAAAGVR